MQQPAAEGGPGESGPVSSLRPVAEHHGSCTSPATEADLQSLASSLRSAGDADELLAAGSLQVRQPGIPASVAALWREASEWHFSRNHYGCFGLNIFPPSGLVELTTQVFGDLECRGDWRSAEQQQQQQQPGPSVAQPGWLVLAAFSEYDYLFCCFDAQSPHFGHVCLATVSPAREFFVRPLLCARR
jgi:hypothetical protein